MPIHEVVARELLEEGADDWLPIDMLLWYARSAGSDEGEDFRQIAAEALNFLLSRGLALVGDLGDSGFEAWSGDVAEIVRRVVASCEEFDWDPRGGSCWISITRNGSSSVS